ncbi:MAG TPA: hypothetical protein VGD49_05620 [Longimicrobiales bacterium]
MKRSALLPVLAALIVAACMRDAPTAPANADASTKATPAVDSSAIAQRNAGVREALSDVTTRLLPALQNTADAEQLSSRLTSVIADVDAGNVDAARRRLGEAQAVLDRIVADAAGSADLADLSFVQLALDQVMSLLGEKTEARQ